ncbi:hypothetical protein [Nocardia arizonensis]|nr:hypothetical protein [Nocardia arizonensis]
MVSSIAAARPRRQGKKSFGDRPHGIGTTVGATRGKTNRTTLEIEDFRP